MYVCQITAVHRGRDIIATPVTLYDLKALDQSILLLGNTSKTRGASQFYMLRLMGITSSQLLRYKMTSILTVTDVFSGLFCSTSSYQRCTKWNRGMLVG